MSHEHERLSAFLDDELSPHERAEVAAHLQACPECAEQLAALGAADAALASLPVEAPAGYFESFPGRVRAGLGSKAARKGLPAWTWAVAAALVLAVVTPLTLRDRPRDLSPTPAPEPRVEPVAAPSALPPAAQQALPAAPGPPAAQPALPAATAPTTTPGAYEERKKQADEPMRANAAGELQKKREADFARAPKDRDERADAPAAGALATAAPEPAPAAPAPAATRERAAAREKESVAKPQPQELAVAAAPAVRQQESVAASKPDAFRDQMAGAASADARGARSQAMRAAPAAAKLSSSEAEWQRLVGVRAGTPEEWRRLREDWRGFVARDPEGARADDARLRMIEAGRAAWRASADPADEATFRQDAAAYLERDAAPQKDRVRRLLAEPFAR